MKTLERILARTPGPVLVGIGLALLIAMIAGGRPWTLTGRRMEQAHEKDMERLHDKIDQEVISTALSGIDLSDGLSVTEARELKYVYLLTHSDGRYSEDPMERTVYGWSFNIYFFRKDYTDTTVHVSREGVVTATGYPTIDYRDK